MFGENCFSSWFQYSVFQKQTSIQPLQHPYVMYSCLNFNFLTNKVFFRCRYILNLPSIHSVVASQKVCISFFAFNNIEKKFQEYYCLKINGILGIIHELTLIFLLPYLLFACLVDKYFRLLILQTKAISIQLFFDKASAVFLDKLLPWMVIQAVKSSFMCSQRFAFY